MKKSGNEIYPQIPAVTILYDCATILSKGTGILRSSLNFLGVLVVSCPLDETTTDDTLHLSRQLSGIAIRLDPSFTTTVLSCRTKDLD